MVERTHRTIWLPLALTWLAFLLRVGGLLSQSLWRDEVDALRFSTQALPALLEMFRKPGENGPLFFLALRPWLAIGGSSEFALRFPSALAGTLAVPLLYTLIRRLTRERSTAIIAALLLATAPYAVWYGQEAKMYAALTVLVPLSFYLAVQASWQGRWWRWTLLYIVTSLSFYTHLLAALALPVQAVWLLILPSLAPGIEPATARRRRLSALLYLALLILPYLPLVQWQLPAWLAADQQTGYPFVPLPTILLVLLTAFSRGILPVTQRLTLLPMVLALLAGIGLWAALPAQGASQARWWRWGVIGLLLAWLLLPALGIYVISLRRPLFADRYLIWALPAFLALAAMGVAALARVWRPLGWDGARRDPGAQPGGGLEPGRAADQVGLPGSGPVCRCAAAARRSAGFPDPVQSAYLCLLQRRDGAVAGWAVHELRHERGRSGCRDDTRHRRRTRGLAHRLGDAHVG